MVKFAKSKQVNVISNHTTKGHIILVYSDKQNRPNVLWVCVYKLISPKIDKLSE